jgi:glycosyltransferase involved in cell wall biosynthesis
MGIMDKHITDKMRVTLILTTYNRIHLLRNAILSIMSQSYQPDELIISDDGSSEDVMGGISDLIKSSDFRVKFVQQADKGFRLAKCRNNAAREASGDFLVFFDQDLAFSKNYLNRLIGSARKKRFVVGYPIRLTKSQSKEITRGLIETGDFSSILTQQQKQRTMMQYRKELLYTVLYKLNLRKIGPKLRGGIAGFFKDDFLKVNGYDEKYEGWGNEDDDLGIRFYGAGIRGINPFKKDYAVHFYHEQFHAGERVNHAYYKQRKREMNKYNFRCRCGYESIDGEEVVVRNIK